MFSSWFLVTMGLLCAAFRSKGQQCQRTNRDVSKNCVRDECLPQYGCTSNKHECLCDGDCGYSCIKKRGVNCGQLNAPQNGGKQVSGTKFNDTAIFTCDQGYVLSGSKVRRCRGNGKWDGTISKCGKLCPDPGIANLTRRDEPINHGGFKTSTTLRYYCDKGFHIASKDTITCQDNGKWDASAPQCLRTSCPAPVLPKNSKVFRPAWFKETSGGHKGLRLLLSCKPGYYKTGGGQSLMACNGTQWTKPSSFACAPVSCGDPGVPQNGGKQGLSYTFKNRVTYYCDKCYELIGARYRECNANGRWSDQMPECKKATKQCKGISNFANGTVHLTSRDCGAEVEFDCIRGFTLNGSRKLVCEEDGEWSETIPICQPILCPSLKLDQRLILDQMNKSVGSLTQFGSRIKFKCSGFNYTLSDDNTISCEESGQWSGRVPECLAPCHAQETRYLKSQKEVYPHGAEAQLTCSPGYKLLGMINNQAPRCDNGKWKALKFPYCLKEEVVRKKRKDFAAQIWKWITSFKG